MTDELKCEAPYNEGDMWPLYCQLHKGHNGQHECKIFWATECKHYDREEIDISLNEKKTRCKSCEVFL